MNIRRVKWQYRGHTHSAWRVDYRLGGKRIQRQFKTKLEAKLYLEKIIRERNSHEYGTLFAESTLKEFIPIYEHAKAWKTEAYRARVLPVLRRLPFVESKLLAISTRDVEDFRDRRMATAAIATVRQECAAISDCLRFAVKLHYLHKNPAEGIERPSLPIKQDDPARYLSREDFDKLIAKAGKDRPLYEFAVWTGLRITELLQLTWEDMQDEYVVVRRGKGRKQRIVPLLEKARKALQKVPVRLQEVRGRVFWWASDRHATLRRFQRRCTWAGIGMAVSSEEEATNTKLVSRSTRPYRFHDLRHTFGSWAAMAGVDLEVIAQCMGHTSTTVTKQYAHLHPSYKRAELAKMEGRKAVERVAKRAKK